MNLTEEITWIPVSERLPDDEALVTVFNASGVQIGWYVAEDDQWYVVSGKDVLITHWAEPPRGPQP